MGFIEYEGWVLDDETFEIIEEGGDIDALVHKAHDAELQIKQWERIAAILKAGIIAKQGTKSAAYGRLVATIVEGSYPVLDAARWRIDVLEGTIPPGVQPELLSRAKTFDRKGLPAELSGLVENYTNHPAKKPYVQISEARKRAPMARVEVDDAAE